MMISTVGCRLKQQRQGGAAAACVTVPAAPVVTFGPGAGRAVGGRVSLERECSGFSEPLMPGDPLMSARAPVGATYSSPRRRTCLALPDEPNSTTRTPQGCSRVAGGRSAAQTTGTDPTAICTPEECQNALALLRGAVDIPTDPVVFVRLRRTPTPGYFLAAFQAADSPCACTKASRPRPAKHVHGDSRGYMPVQSRAPAGTEDSTRSARTRLWGLDDRPDAPNITSRRVRCADRPAADGIGIFH